MMMNGVRLRTTVREDGDLDSAADEALDK